MKKRYWMCVIGPTDHDALPDGADGPLRSAVREAFEKTTGHEDAECWSGWDLSEERMEEILKVWNRQDEEREADTGG